MGVGTKNNGSRKAYDFHNLVNCVIDDLGLRELIVTTSEPVILSN